MAVKLTGAEYKAFMDSDWGDCFMDDYVIAINGVDFEQMGGGLEDAEDAMQPSDKVVIKGGDIFTTNESSYVRSLEAHFKLWRKKQTTAILSVECPNDKLDAVKAAIVAAGGKVK